MSDKPELSGIKQPPYIRCFSDANAGAPVIATFEVPKKFIDLGDVIYFHPLNHDPCVLDSILGRMNEYRGLIVDMRCYPKQDMFEDVIRQSSSTKPSLPEIIDIDEVCRITGYKKSTIYDFIHKRVMPCHKPAHGGRRVFFKRSEIIAFMQKTRIKTREEAFEKHE